MESHRLGLDWFVYGSVTLQQTDGVTTILRDSYDFLPHGYFLDNPGRNFEIFMGFSIGTGIGILEGTDFLIRFSGQPNVIK